MKKQSVFMLALIAGIACLGLIVRKEYLNQKAANAESSETAADTVESAAPAEPDTAETTAYTVTLATEQTTIPSLSMTTVSVPVTTSADPVIAAEPVALTAVTVVTAAPATVTAPAPQDPFGSIVDFWGSTGEAERARDLLIAKDGYDKKRRSYNNAYKELHPQRGTEVGLNILHKDKLAALAAYSPLAGVINDYAGEIHTNPYLMMKKLTKTAYIDGGSVKQTHALSDAVRSPEVFTDPVSLIQTALCEQFGDGSYYIGYSTKDNLYYTYLVDADQNLCVTALYFKFSKNGVLTGIGADYGIYTGGELRTLKGDMTAERLDVLNLDSEGAIPMYLGNESNAPGKLTDFITALLGSATKPENFMTAGTVIAEESVRVDSIAAGETGAKGLFCSTWFTVS